VGSGEVAKEAISDVVAWLAEHEKAKVAEAVDALGLSILSEGELERVVDDLIEENRGLLAERSEKAFGILMGLMMKRVRGRANTEVVSELVTKKLKNLRG
jgi:glutamyl-tRNA(Gln) amidotransferase subunit E